MLLGGIRDMATVPDLVFVVDIRREDTAVREANKLEIPIVAMVDTNCNPQDIDYIIPSNDDAIRAIKLIVGKIADAVLEGKAMRKDLEEETQVEAAAAFDVDTELTDEDLLGESTLAKLQAQRDEETEAEDAAVEAEAGETEEAEAEVEAEETEEVEAVEETEAEAEVEDAEEAEEEAEETEAEETEEETEVEEEAPEEEEAEEADETAEEEKEADEEEEAE